MANRLLQPKPRREAKRNDKSIQGREVGKEGRKEGRREGTRGLHLLHSILLLVLPAGPRGGGSHPRERACRLLALLPLPTFP